EVHVAEGLTIVRAANPGIERDGRLKMGFGTVVEAKRLIGRADRPADGRLDGGPVLELACQCGRSPVEQLAHGKAGAARIEPGRGLVEQLEEEAVNGLGLVVG